MKSISTRVKVLGLTSICLWTTGSFLIYYETKGMATSIITAVMITAGLCSLEVKERKKNAHKKPEN